MQAWRRAAPGRPQRVERRLPDRPPVGQHRYQASPSYVQIANPTGYQRQSDTGCGRFGAHQRIVDVEPWVHVDQHALVVFDKFPRQTIRPMKRVDHQMPRKILWA